MPAVTTLTADEVGAFFDVVRVLRPHIATADELTRLTRQMADEGGAIFVGVRAEGVPVGFASARIATSLRSRGWYCYVYDLIIHPDARRRGYGQMLIERLTQIAREAGCQRIELASRPTNTAAHAFYKRLGFGVVGVKFALTLASGDTPSS